MNATESRFIEKPGPLSRVAQEREHPRAGSPRPAEPVAGSEAEWLRVVQKEFPKFVPFLTRNCGVEFSGRILEIGAGAAWFSAELSKLPKVVEIIATDVSSRQLREDAPKVFKLLQARQDKITRMPADFHRLDFPSGHFDFVVCAGLLHNGVNVTQVLREARRVLKPGGRFVAIREPVKPWVKLKSKSKARTRLLSPETGEPFYTRAEYEDFFARANLALEVKRVNLSSGFKYFFNQVVNGLTHARYAFVATKRGKA